MNVQTVLVLLLVVGVALFVLQRSGLRRRGGYVDPKSPLWLEATRKAQATVPLLAQLHASSGVPAMVKYRLMNAKGEAEHVWGELQQIHESSFTVSLETPLVGGSAVSPPPYELPLTALEDWQVQLPDGKIRGGFTTQAQIVLTRQAGGKLPPHIASIEGRFVDG